jgi:membrane protease YdiL (CAAX protease family)
MSVTKRAIVFLLLVFGVSWAEIVIAWSSGVRDLASAEKILAGYVFSLTLAAVVCSLVFEKGQRLEALGLHFRPNWWWLWALLISIGLTILTVLITALFSPYKLVGIEDMARQLAALQNQQYTDAKAYLLTNAGAMALRIAGFIVLFTLSEELGWRGYLYHLWRRFGFWRYSVAVGLIWGVWHWPMIYLFGFDYPDQRVLGLFILPILAVLAAAIMTVVRDRGGSVWAAGIMHGTSDAMAVLTLITLNGPQFPWTVVGISGIAASAIVVLLIAMFGLRHPHRAAWCA